MNKILILFSGGRTSAFMCKLILEHPKYKDYEKLFVFSNTGKEREETLCFVDKCDKEFDLKLVWVEADISQTKGEGTNFKIVDFRKASRNGEPFDKLNKKYGLPSKLWRHCTRELKEVPIHKYAKSIFGNDYLTAIGIRADEKHRLRNKPNNIYPLAEIGIDEKIVRSFWGRQTFDLELKDYEGNCDLCFLKSTRKKLTIISENPNVVDWWNEQELKYQNEKQSKFDVYRDNSIMDLVELAKHPFRKALDKHEVNTKQQSLFELEMDLEFDCFCKMT